MDPLADLRDYRLPDPVSWWPPAPGWWLLALVGLGVLALATYWAFRQRQRGAAARAARAELDILMAAYRADGDEKALLRGLSRLLRRLALARFPRSEVAGLTGEAWLGFLDERGGEGGFVDGVGRVFALGPYRRDGSVPADELAALVGRWIDRQRAGREAVS